ncbi:chorismate mutase [Paenibacillus harenae]|uniref:chorismate mutase n=1 Tax=Paenibacillus harenae TaxID=306543 RepID=UPI00042021A4|nr:chorismate mutase [Paenibacillus harenae]
MEASKLEEWRQGIDRLDGEIIALLAERFKLTEEIGRYKARNKLEAQDPQRESRQFEKIMNLSNRYELNPDYSSAIYRCVMDVVISRHQELKQACDSGLASDPIGVRS